MSQEKFLEKSINERIYLRKIYQNLIYQNKFDWKLFMTDEMGYDVWDARLIKFEKNTSKILSNYYIEIKSREIDYDSLMLEKIKYENLKKIVYKMDFKNNKECYTNYKSKIIYISTTPNGSWWFNLSNLITDDMEWEIKNCPVSSMNLSRGRIDKQVTFLDKTKGKHFPIKLGDIDVTDKFKIEKHILNQKQNMCIFGGLV